MRKTEYFIKEREVWIMIKRKRNIVVMDGSDVKKLATIVWVSRMVVNNKNALNYRMLDIDHPTMQVLEVKCSKRQYEYLQYVIDNLYPGLCTYDVAV